MAEAQPRHWDLLLVIFLLLGAIGAGEYWFYGKVLAEKAARMAAAAPKPAPVPAPKPIEEPPPPAPVEEVAKVEPPPAQPKPKPKPFSQKIRSRQQAGRGGDITYIVQGTDRGAMFTDVALDAFVSAFYDTDLEDPLGKASRATKSKWVSWVKPHVREVGNDVSDQGLVVTYKADVEKIRAGLSIQGFSFKGTVPSFAIENNGSYAPDDKVLGILMNALKEKSPFFVGKTMFAAPDRVGAEINGMRVVIDDEPYTVSVAKTKDFGGSALGQSILYYVDVIPAG